MNQRARSLALAASLARSCVHMRSEKKKKKVLEGGRGCWEHLDIHRRYAIVSCVQCERTFFLHFMLSVETTARSQAIMSGANANG